MSTTIHHHGRQRAMGVLPASCPGGSGRGRDLRSCLHCAFGMACWHSSVGTGPKRGPGVRISRIWVLRCQGDLHKYLQEVQLGNILACFDAFTLITIFVISSDPKILKWEQIHPSGEGPESFLQKDLSSVENTGFSTCSL